MLATISVASISKIYQSHIINKYLGFTQNRPYYVQPYYLNDNNRLAYNIQFSQACAIIEVKQGMEKSLNEWHNMPSDIWYADYSNIEVEVIEYIFDKSNRGKKQLTINANYEMDMFKRVYAYSGEKMIVFIDDLDNPFIDNDCSFIITPNNHLIPTSLYSSEEMNNWKLKKLDSLTQKIKQIFLESDTPYSEAYENAIKRIENTSNAIIRKNELKFLGDKAINSKIVHPYWETSKKDLNSMLWSFDMCAVVTVTKGMEENLCNVLVSPSSIWNSSYSEIEVSVDEYIFDRTATYKELLTIQPDYKLSNNDRVHAYTSERLIIFLNSVPNTGKYRTVADWGYIIDNENNLTPLSKENSNEMNSLSGRSLNNYIELLQTHLLEDNKKINGIVYRNSSNNYTHYSDENHNSDFIQLIVSGYLGNYEILKVEDYNTFLDASVNITDLISNSIYYGTVNGLSLSKNYTVYQNNMLQEAAYLVQDDNSYYIAHLCSFHNETDNVPINVAVSVLGIEENAVNYIIINNHIITNSKDINDLIGAIKKSKNATHYSYNNSLCDHKGEARKTITLHTTSGLVLLDYYSNEKTFDFLGIEYRFDNNLISLISKYD